MRTMRLIALGAGIAAFVGACTEVERTNPFDPKMNVIIEVTGPDTVRSSLQPFDIQVNITPPWPDVVLVWEHSPDVVGLVVNPTSRTYSVPVSYTWPSHWPVTVKAGPHATVLRIPMKQEVAQIQFTPCEPYGCVAYLDPFEITPRQVEVRYRDAGNGPIRHLDRIPDSVFASVVVRDEGVVQKTSVNHQRIVLYPNSQGKTWVVAPAFGTDSIAVYADYILRSLEATCPSTIAVGETSSMTVAGKGHGGVTLVRPLALAWDVANHVGVVSMNTPGELTGVAPGAVRVRATEGIHFVECFIEVVP